MITKIIALFLFLFALTLSSCKDCKFESIRTDTLPNALYGKQYETSIEYDCNCTVTHREANLESGSLPPGLELDVTGKIKGKPTRTGSFNFTISMKICFQLDGAMPYDCYFKEKTFSILVL
jgi:hypothetical protein